MQLDYTVIRQDSTANAEQSGARAVKTPGRGFVLTRFLLPFYRLEKEEPVRLKDRNYKKTWLFVLKKNPDPVNGDLIAKIRNDIGILIERVFCPTGNDKFIFFSTCFFN